MLKLAFCIHVRNMHWSVDAQDTFSYPVTHILHSYAPLNMATQRHMKTNIFHLFKLRPTSAYLKSILTTMLVSKRCEDMSNRNRLKNAYKCKQQIIYNSMSVVLWLIVILTCHCVLDGSQGGVLRQRRGAVSQVFRWPSQSRRNQSIRRW